MVGLNDFGSLFQTKQFYDYVKTGESLAVANSHPALTLLGKGAEMRPAEAKATHRAAKQHQDPGYSLRH